MSSPTRIAAVTGANKGIGLAIVRQLALQYPKSPFQNGPILIYLTARDLARGEEALKSIHSDPQLKKAKVLRQDGGLATVEYQKLDISDTKSIHDFTAHLKKEHPDGIDFLINNAGIAMQGFDINVVRNTLKSNYYGTLEVSSQILPHIQDGGRLVNVASMSGHLSKYSSDIKNRFLRAKSVSDITALMEDFTTAVANNEYQAKGWPGAAYATSEAGVIGMTKALAQENKSKGSRTLINSCCPGYVNTDMTRGRGAKTPDQGAQTPVLLAIGDIAGANGQFWQNERPIEW